MRLFFATDVHGSTTTWRKWLSVPHFYKVTTLMFCGDLTGKAMVPVIKQNDETYVAFDFGKRVQLKKEIEVMKFEEKFASYGFYPLRCTKEEVEELKTDRRKVENTMEELAKKRMKEWLDLLVEKIDLKKIKVIVMEGNDDSPDINDVIKSYEDQGVIRPLGKVVDICGFETISLEYVNPTPWKTPKEMSEDDLKRKIENMVQALSDPKKSVFNFHCPPYNTNIDKAPKLDKNLKPVTVAGAVAWEHVGSKSVRQEIEKYQPIIGLHGHIHESSGQDKLGSTPVINPGSEYAQSILRGYILEFSRDGLETYWRVQG